MKNFKRSITFFFVVLAISASMFSSCSKEDANAKSTLMNHDWVLKTIEDGDDVTTQFFELTYALVTTTYSFEKNDKLTITSKFLMASDKEEGTWSVSDDGNELTINGSTSEIIELTSKVLKIGPSDAIMSGFDETGDSTYIYTIVFEAK